MSALFARYFLISFLVFNVRAEVKDRYYPRYHLAPPYGWMNDPNGFCVFKDEYHLFYQYNPESSLEPGIAHWGHAKSKDLFHWEPLPIAMYPDQWYDRGGVFSGSAIVEDDTMYLLYTGNILYPNQSPDHEQHQALAISTDGVNVTKYIRNPIISRSDRQPDLRDPKVWKHNDTYYMVLGNSFENRSLGRVLLYSSQDMLSWQEVVILDESRGPLGYMWECPDFFEIDGYFVLLFSPQGMKAEGDKYNNLYQTGYIVGKFDYNTNIFIPVYNFTELDHGHDYYATQTIEDTQGRRILVAWLDMWDQKYPEENDGWTGLMTVPRILTLSEDGLLLQNPVSEISNARGRKLYSANGRSANGQTITLDDKAGEVIVEAAANTSVELIIKSSNTVVTISYDVDDGKITLNRGGTDGIRRTNWRPIDKLKWRLFIDASSIELFCGNGEVTFSSRFFPNDAVAIRLGESTQVERLTVNAMLRTVPKPGYSP